MKPEAQRIAIAEACGYTSPFKICNEWEERDGMDGYDGFFETLRDNTDRRVPNYLNDLNAMYEAEKHLQHYGVFVDQLAIVMKQPRQGIMLIHATAAQRAEAFLRTTGKWEE